MKKVIICITLVLLLGSTLGGAIYTPIKVQDDQVIESSVVGPMDSPWPMFQHDPQHTGRSPFGPTGNTPRVKWKFWMDGMAISSPAIDKNGTLYMGASDFTESFFAINPNGTEKWKYGMHEFVLSSPAIANDGTVYVGSNDGYLYSFAPNGTMKWRVKIGEGWVKSSPVIDTDGIIYAASVISYRLCAVFPNGTIKWSFYTEDAIYCSPGIDNNDVIYIGSNDGYMYAVSSNGTLNWKFYAGGPKGIGSAPTIETDGTVYFGSTNGYLYGLNPDGTLKWKFNTGYWIGGSSPAISEDGTIYVGTNNCEIYSINPDGSKNWEYTVDDEISASPLIDEEGKIYCGDWDGYLYALNPDGTLHWKLATLDGIESSPIIDENGIIYVAAWNSSGYSYLYALEIIENEPPATPTIDGPTEGKINTEYTYTVVSTDPEENNISYFYDWGDGTSSGWTEFIASGDEISLSHNWTDEGDYVIKVKARDEYNIESDWGTFEVTMPKNKPIMTLFESRFPRLFSLLNLFNTIL